MAFIDIYPTYWVQCRRHGVIFCAIDLIWSNRGHEDCALDDLSRYDPVIILNEPFYDPKDKGEQRILCCWKCNGQGHLVTLDMRYAPRFHTMQVGTVECQRCKGRGYI